MVWCKHPLCGVLVGVVVLLGSSMSGCSAEPVTPTAADGRLSVAVSVVPQQYFVERIGGDHVVVMVMVGPGDSPETYEPKPEQLKALSRSEAYFSIGVALEDVWLDRITGANPRIRIVDTIEGIDRHPMDAEHGHDDSAAAAVGAPDPHVWVSPELVKIQANNIYEALAELDPTNTADYRANLSAFLADIDALTGEIQETLAGAVNRKFMVLHPSWGYFADEFGLQQIAIEIGGQEPSAKELAELIQTARAARIQVVFAQPEFSTVDAQTIAEEIGGKVLLISPLAYDWLENLRTVAVTFAEVLAE